MSHTKSSRARLFVTVGLALGLLFSGVSSSNADVLTPGVPTKVIATRGNASATVSWQAPSNNGGSPITGYTVTASLAGVDRKVTAAATATSATISGLRNGAAYSITVTAANAAGSSLSSDPVLVIPSLIPAGLPSVPRIVSISTKTSRGLGVTYTIGSSNGSTITAIEYTVDGGTNWQTAEASPYLITGLTNGTSYSVSLRAVNAVGAGTATLVRTVKPVGTANPIAFSQPTPMSGSSTDQALSASSPGGTIVYASLTATVCSVVNGAIHPLAAGTCRVKATNVGDEYFAASAPVTKSVVIAKAPLTIDFPNIGSVTTTGGDVSLGVTARLNGVETGSTELVSMTPTVCTIVAGKLHPFKAGVCTIRATNSGSSLASAATAVTRSVTISTSTPTSTPSASATTTPSASATPSVTATALATPTPTVTTPTATPTPTIPAVVNIRLTSADKAYMTDKSYWWTNEAASYSWVKFVTAGDVLTLHYTVTTSGGSPIVNALVTLNAVAAGGASFSGAMTARTNASGVATFSLTSTTSESSAEPTPTAPSAMWYWDDSRSVSPQLKWDITPTVGATTEHIDRVWTHTVKSAASGGLNKTLLWSDEFTGTAGSSPSSTYWSMRTGDGCSVGNCGWGNRELEFYETSANKLDGSTDGVLNITASKLPDTTSLRCAYPTSNSPCQWSSGKIESRDKVSFSYGYLEARVQVPAGAGTWPAFWTLGTNIGSVSWPRCGEIDIMEAFGKYPKVQQGTAHMANPSGQDAYYYGQIPMPEALSAGYHTFGVNWQPTRLDWYIDGYLFYSLSKSSVGNNAWPFDSTATGATPKAYAILNLAIGGNLGGDVASGLTSAVMKVDYVRYYSVDGVGAVSLP